MIRFPSSPAALLAEMVAVPSVNPEGDPGDSAPGEKAYGVWLADRLRALGADVSIHALAPGQIGRAHV